MKKCANTSNIQIEIAPAGYYVLEVGKDENGAPFDIIKHPVIAWKFDHADPYAFFIPSAILLGGDAEKSNEFMNAPVLSPCGLVRHGTDEFWESEDSYFQYRKQVHQEMLEPFFPKSDLA